MRKLLVAVLLAVAAVLAVPTTAGACSCVGGTIAELAADADAVFTGTVTAFDGDHHSGPPWTATFDVETVYEGDVAAEVSVESPNQDTACGLRMEEGTRWTILADQVDGGALRTSLCSGSVSPPADAAELGLGAGHPPLPGSTATEPAGYSWWVYPAGIVVGVVGGLLIVRRLQRRR